MKPDRSNRTIVSREHIAALPKAELHVHLEGSMRRSTFRDLSRRYGAYAHTSFASMPDNSWEFHGIDHFLTTYGQVSSVLRTPDDFLRLVCEYGADAVAQGIRYAELTVTPETHRRYKGLPFDELMDALWIGAQKVQRDHGIILRFILDHVRQYSVEDCERTAAWCVAAHERGVVALGLAGTERGNPMRPFRDAVAWARERGVAFVPHAGEVTDARDVWDALEFNPPRIAHGIRAAGDVRLMEVLRERGIVLDVCPTSNIRLGNVPSMGMHPILSLHKHGVRMTINTDDPGLIGTTLIAEYEFCVNRMGFNLKDLAIASLTGARAALVNTQERERLVRDFQLAIINLGVPMDIPSFEDG